MTAGSKTESTKSVTLRLLEGRTSTNSAPSGSSAGVDATGLFGSFTKIEWAVLCVSNSAGSVTVTATIRLWGYVTAIAKWFPLGVGADATKGVINANTALGETGTDTINHCEPVYYVSAFDRLYAEVTAIGGTSTAVDVDLVCAREVA